MPSMQFQPVLRDVREVLGSDYYSIPRFQRPYSWTSENLEDFWRDVVLDNDEGYFIGPMVAYNLRKGEFGIVDGQQRLTSIMLALASIRDLFVELQESDLAKGMAKYIERADDDSQVHFVLQSAAAKAFLPSQILAAPPRHPKKPTNEEERALAKAFNEIKSWLGTQIANLSTDPGPKNTPSEAAKHLRSIRERILGLRVIWIRLDEEDDAYIIFETLNSRGKDLEVVDLLKNHLLSHVRQENADLDTARANWEEMRRTLEEDGARANANKFILHWWLSTREYTAERKLFRLIRKTTKKPEATALIHELETDAHLYAKIVNPHQWQIPKGEAGTEVRDSLLALSIFGVSQPRPMLLSLLRSWDSKQIKYSKLRKAVSKIEVFHYITTAIVGMSSTGGISEMYAKHARELASAETEDERMAAIDTLVAKLSNSARLPSRETFIAEFARTLRFSEQETTQKRLVQYTLKKLQDHEKPGVALDHSKCNIEHLSSQSDGEDWMPAIGNLLWIEAGVNARLGTKPFAKKVEILKEYTSTYPLDDVVNHAQWGEDQSNARSARLAELAIDHVWPL